MQMTLNLKGQSKMKSVIYLHRSLKYKHTPNIISFTQRMHLTKLSHLYKNNFNKICAVWSTITKTEPLGLDIVSLKMKCCRICYLLNNALIQTAQLHFIESCRFHFIKMIKCNVIVSPKIIWQINATRHCLN